jgi:hypothetical protein
VTEPWLTKRELARKLRVSVRTIERLKLPAMDGDIYRYCYVRGPDGIIIGLVEELR